MRKTMSNLCSIDTLTSQTKSTCVAVVLLATLCGVIGCNSNPSTDAHSPRQASSATAALANYTALDQYVTYSELDTKLDTTKPMRFEIVDDSGIEFSNILKRENFKQLIGTGSGVACGDFDQDGNVDVYLVSTDGPNRMFRGLGNFKFEDVTDELELDGAVEGKNAWGSGATFADVDDDGDLDLFVCNMSSPNLLYVNQGDGTFEERAGEAGLAYRGASKVGTFCDYDRDGDLDMFLLTYQDDESSGQGKLFKVGDELRVAPGYEEVYGVIEGHVFQAGERDRLYENDGHGSFREVGAPAGIDGYEMGLSATWFDFDNDHWLDLYVANDFKGPDKLYRNNRDGTFTDIIGNVTNHTTWFSMGSCAGDLNNDGYEDLMVADMSGTNHYKQKVNMGNMSDNGWFLTYGHPRQYMRNSLFINTGMGCFLESAFMSHLESTDWTWAVKFCDLDNDGWQDIFVTNGHARNTMDSDLVNESKRKIEDLSPSEAEEYQRNLPPIKEANLVFRNLGELKFQPVGESWNLDLLGISHGVAFADFDRDGDLDMVVNNLNKPATVYRNESNTGNRLLVELRGTESNHFGYGAKVEIWRGQQYQQRRLIPVSGYLSSDEPILHFGVSDWEQIDRLVVTWPNGKQQEINDLPVNRIYRISENTSASSIAANADTQGNETNSIFAPSGNVEIREPEDEFDDFAREPLLPYKLSQLGPGVAWGDVNQDGYPDVFVGRGANRDGTLFVNLQGNGFEKQKGPWLDDFLQEDMGVVFFDANGDGIDDLFVVSGSNEFPLESPNYRDRLYLNDGNGGFSLAEPGVLPDLRDSGSSVAVADFDRDGDLDLFVGSRSIPGKYPLTPASRLLRNDGGKFVDVTREVSDSLQEAGMVNSALWSDFDSDGWTDLILAIDWGPVRFFQNQQGWLVDVTSEAGLENHSGWWHGLAAGDLDNDGDLDYVATNHGLNTKYHCSADRPLRLYYHDFDGNGTLDLVESEFEDGVELPMRGRSCSSRCMPFIAEKFETFHEFAMADIGDIYEIDTNPVPHADATELRSMVIWNNGKDGFSMEPLPWLAQISPSFGVGIADFDQDGNLDLLLSQNFFGAQPETGYMDGGLSLLLTGDGNRNFHAVWPKESGIVVPDDALATGIADFDKDGDLDAVFVSNRGPIRFFENKSQKKNVSIVVKGDGSNHRAIGTQVVLRSGSQTRLFEVNGTTGYLGNSLFDPGIPNSFASELTEAEIRWPNGSTSKVLPKVENGKITIRQETQQVD